MVISRVIIRVTPFRALITLLITYLLSPLPLQVRTTSATSPIVPLFKGALNHKTRSPTPTVPLLAEVSGRVKFNGNTKDGLLAIRQAGQRVVLVAEWIHFTLFGIISPTTKLKLYTFGGI